MNAVSLLIYATLFIAGVAFGEAMKAVEARPVRVAVNGLRTARSASISPFRF